MSPQSPQLATGTRVGGKYEIKALLGEGANGSVYEGEHCEIGHRVAIKVVHRSLASRDDIIARFRREARICGTIRHKNVGQVYDVGELPDGAPYMVMELHEGHSLASMVAEQGPLPFAMVRDVGRQLLQGLGAVHDSGAIHRDIKPDNVMIVREPDGGMLLKLVDFGIGKSVTSDIRLRNVTQEGMVVGSPDYMPPEQLRGDGVDHRVDLYAAGVVLYELVTGRVPFHAESLTELFVAILRDPVKAPGNVRPDCPAELERLIVRALSREAGERFQSASEMERALSAVKVPPGAARTSTPDLQLPPPKRRATTEGYALETERVRTAELQIPIRRAGPLRAAIGLLVFVLAGVGGWFVLGAVPKPASPAALPVAAHAPPPATPVPHAAPPAEPATVFLPATAPAGTAELAGGGAVLDPGKPNEPEADPEPVPSGRSEPEEKSTPEEPAQRERIAKARKASKSLEGEKAKPVEEPAAAEPAAAAGPGSISPEALVQEAAAAFVRGQLPRAKALYREAAQQAPGNADAWRGLAMASSRMGQREEAERALNRYLALRPNAPDAEALRQKLTAQ